LPANIPVFGALQANYRPPQETAGFGGDLTAKELKSCSLDIMLAIAYG
jgi:hypothetical protein